MNAPPGHATNYQVALARYLDGDGESALNDAYEIGRQALRDGLGVLDIAALHDSALRDWYTQKGLVDAIAPLQSASAFFAESLSCFEMHSRQIDESKAAWRRLHQILEDEVKRISRALHDEASNIIAQAALEMDIATTMMPAEVRDRLASTRRLLDETGEHLRHLSHELRPPVLDDLGLVAALEFLADGVERRTGLSVRVIGTLPKRVSPKAELVVYRIAQEALNNTLRHGSGVKTAAVQISQADDCLHCEIHDDGVGFEVDAVMADATRRGLGLLGMRERAAALGGDCSIRSTPGEGTIVDVRLPIHIN